MVTLAFTAFCFFCFGFLIAALLGGNHECSSSKR